MLKYDISPSLRTEMPMSKAGVKKRLKRLLKSGICPAEDASEYASELKQLAEKAIESDFVRKQSNVFKALADETRLKILSLLQLREMCVCEIMIALDLTQPTASHHLGLLESAGLVKDRREGKWVFYSLADKKMTEKLREIGIV
jgi:ArsR family transcriptional regulator